MYALVLCLILPYLRLTDNCPDLKDTGYIANIDTIILGVTMHVTYLSGHNDTHDLFMRVTDLTDRYYN